MSGRLHDKVAIITGAASGFGAEEGSPGGIVQDWMIERLSRALEFDRMRDAEWYELMRE